jgi:hypothetical protein
MKAKKYKIRVSEGVLAHVHGMDYEIDEIYVPEVELYINKEAAFVADGERANLGSEHEEIDVNGALAKLLSVALKEKESAEKRLREELGLEKD